MNFNFEFKLQGLFPFKISLIVSTALIIFGAMPTQANDVGIAAVVNDRAISDYDLNRRVDFTLKMAGMESNKKNREKLREQVLDSLIVEALKQQEAAKYGITNSKEDVEGAVMSVEAQNGLPAGGLKEKLKKINAPIDVLYAQVGTDLLWVKTVRMSLANKVKLDERSVEERYKKYVAEAKKERYLLAEIFIPSAADVNAKSSYATAMEVIDGLRAGKTFNELAEKYSKAPSAIKGGDMGWVLKEDLPEELKEPLATLDVGQLSIPIKTNRGYYIMLMRDRAGGDLATKFSLAKITVPDSYKKENPDYITKLKEEAKTCPSFVNYGKKIYADGAGFLNEAPMSAFPEKIQKVLKGLEEKTVSEAVKGEDKEMFFMICSHPKDDSVSKDMVKASMESEQLEALAKRRLKELRNSAVIEIRE